MSNPIRDLSGKQFSRLRVQWPAGLQGSRVLWLTLCKCGNLRIARGTHLTGGGVRSCGCLVREVARALILKKNPSLRHGHARHGKVTREFRTWDAMRQRCLNPKDQKYKDYGGRGIKICQRWLDSFENFLADMGPKPKGLSIDRRDNDGNYTPKNCRWATPLQQRHNQRRTQ